jgi:hypothetical protein
MAVIAPNSEIYLIKCPIELDNLNQLSFANETAQHNYFNSLPKLALSNATFQRKDGTIRWPGSMEDILEYNYCMYRNKNHGNKWFYAFITEMTYISDNMTAIGIKTDVFQTWIFSLTFKQCFVEREHVSDDTFGLHTLEENIPAGEWVSNGNEQISIENPKSCFVAALISELPEAMRSRYGNTLRVYNGVPNGCYMIMIDVSDSYLNMNHFISYFDSVGKAEAIVAMYLVPKSIMGTPGTDYIIMSFDLGEYGFDGILVNASSGVKQISSTNVTRNSTIDGYTPKNNKCFTRQFNYLMITNNAGGNATYYWEDFTGTPNFKLFCTYQQTTPTKLVPTNYKRNDEPGGNIYSLTGCPFPIVSWKSDYYLNWQAKNGWSSVSKSAEELTKWTYQPGSDLETNIEAGGDLGRRLGNYIGSELNAIKNTIFGANREAEMIPDPVKGNPTNNDFTFSINKCKFTLYKMSMRAEVARIVDKYFSAYGYKVSTWKVPNISGRQNWNYVKLNQANIIGDVPQSDLEEIKSIFVNGITIWHNSSTFLDYSQNNNIVS